MRRRKFNAVKLNTKLMVDVVGASLIVQKVPDLLKNWFGLDPMISKIGAVGVGYVVGSMIKRPDLSNASIALAASDFIIPLIDGILPGGGSTLPTGAPVPIRQVVPGTRPVVNTKPPTGMVTVDDYFNLNDYVDNPNQKLPFLEYSQSYSY